MSYTTFEYSKPVISAQTMNTDGSIDVSVKVKNTGKVAGKRLSNYTLVMRSVVSSVQLRN